MLARNVARTASHSAYRPLAVGRTRPLHTIPAWHKKAAEKPAPAQNTPTFDSRTSARQGSTAETPAQHPGYTTAEAPVTSAHPKEMPGSEGYKRASELPHASTHTDPQHPGIHEMARGAETTGVDATKPEDRNVKGWGPNARSADFNPNEGKRNPVLHGGSNEGGHDASGKSKT